MTKDMNELNKKIREVWEREFDPKKNPPMPVTLFEDLVELMAEQVRLGRLRGIEEVLLRLKQAPPIDWIDAQAWIDGEYERLQAQLKQGASND